MASSARIDELRKKFDENPRRYFAPLANEYRKAGDLEQAIFICQEYLPQQPGHMSGHIVYGQALFELARLDEARQVFETALSLDPENLIALRHLGDIARQTGDSRTARSWYQRVLEADPRNEEIAQIMLSLLATPAAPQPAVETLAPTPAPTPTPLGTPVVSDATATGFEPTSLTFEVEKSTDGSDLAVGPELGALPGRQTPASAPLPVEPIAAAPISPAPAPEHDLLDIDDFTIGGVPLMEVAAAPSVDEPSTDEESFDEESFTEAPDAFVSDAIPTPSVPSPAFAAPAPELDDLDAMIERSGDPFEADPLAIAAATPPSEDLAADMILGLPDDGASSMLSAPDDMAVLGLETFESGIVVPPTPEPVEVDPSVDFEALFTSHPDAREPLSHPDAREASGGPAFSAVTEPPAAADEAQTSHPDARELLSHPDAREALSHPDAREASGGSAFPPFPTLTDPVATDTSSEPSFDPTPEPGADLAPAAFGGGESAFDSALPSDANASVEFETPIARVEAHTESPAPSFAQNPTPIVTPAIEASAYTPPAATAFVTETMAELYLQQGHVESAIEIYHQLVAQRPDDPVLQERLSVLERQLSHGDTSAAAPSAPAVAGPTIREFLTGLLWPSSAADAAAPASEEPVVAGFDAAYADGPPSIDEDFGALVDPVEPPVTSADTIAAEAADVSFTAPTPLSSPAIDAFDLSAPTPLSTPAIDAFDLSAPTPLSTPAVDTFDFGGISPVEPDVAHRPTPASRGTPAVASETVSGSIDALFSGVDASTTDASAASTLAQAFASEAPDAPLHGMPAHAAENELSLDHVFKTGPAPRPSGETEAFSFDQFFADEMLDGGKGPGSAPAAPGNGDDIEQFNNWLNGLKKT